MKKEKSQLTPQKYKKKIREYYEQLYTNKFDNLEEMDTFLETHNLSTLNQEEIENLNRPILSIEIESVIKISRARHLTGEFFQMFRKQHQFSSNSSKISKRREQFQTHSTSPSLL